LSGKEGPAVERLRSFFEAHDRLTALDTVGNVHAPGDDAVLFTSHVDTVPGEIPIEVAPAADGSGPALWGRGSVDATGSLAAMAVAAVRTGVSFVGVVGEETDSRGARHLVARREAPEAVLNGEPTGTDGYALGYRGLLAGTYTVETESTHSSRPDSNAVQRGVSWWTRVEQAFTDRTLTTDAGPEGVFESVTVTPVTFEGDTTADGLATRATVDFQVRVPPDRTVDALREAVTSTLDEGSIEWTDAIAPWTASARTPLARAIRVAVRAEGETPQPLRKTGTCDANLFAETWDCPVAVYGPGDASLDHAPDEHLSLAEFDHATAVLERVARELTNDNDTDTTTDST
jgi:LysW-gamma-L-lysine carboxypeptidase